jgi:peptide deformylase
MRAADLLTHIDNKEDLPFLRIPLFDVNMRLFNGAEYYRNIVLRICKDLKWLALNQFEDYTRPYGLSCANMGIPFNIIGYVVGRGTSRPDCLVMINPKIRDESHTTHEALSNCGSIRLPEPIRVRRRDWIEVRYFSEDGRPARGVYARASCGDTIQHEVDHNRGILITDLAGR